MRCTIPWRCRFGFHNWPKWGGMKEFDAIMTNRITGMKAKATIIIQERSCPDCNRYQRRQVSP